MDKESMVDALKSYESYQIDRLTFALAAAYKTIVEIIEYYERMDGYDEMDRLGDVREWLAEALGGLFGERAVEEWETEAKSLEFSPFAE